MTGSDVFLLGGWQSDFADKAPGGEIYPLLESATVEGLDTAGVRADEVGVVHVGNLGGEVFNGQALLGGMVAAVDPALHGTPSARHEAACASGSVAALAAMTDVQAGHYDVALVVGAEVLRNVPGQEAGQRLEMGAWVGREAVGEKYPWPHLFARLADEYGERHGIEHAHLGRIAELNIANARRNPNAQSRDWAFEKGAFSEDDFANPRVAGMLRKQDCGRITDGSAAVVLASRSFADAWADRRGVDLASVPRIEGWGHATGTLLLEDKLALSKDAPYVLPHVRQTILDAYRRAGIDGPGQLDAIEVHDCFSISEYAAIDHFGITAPGESWKAVEDGRIAPDGELPINPSGGLIGLGHPVGATGVRMLLDAAKQVSGAAGDYQVDGARRMATLNLGGSFTTVVSFVVSTA